MTTGLTPADYEAILRALPELHKLRDLAQLPPVVLRLLSGLIPCLFATYNEFNFRTRAVVLVCEPERWTARMAEVMEAGHRYREQHPFWKPMESTPDGRSLLISDFLAPDALQRTDFYRECLASLGIEETMLISLQMSSKALAFICLNRERRDFTARDRQVADLLQPHILAAYENAAAFTDARALALLSARASDQSAHGIALLGADGRVLHINPRAWELLERYFRGPDTWRADLPAPLREWLTPADRPALAPPHAYEIQSNGRRLVCRATDTGEGQRLVLVQEAPLRPAPSRLAALGLSPREADVMLWMTEGKSNGDIAAILGISRRTVEKHLESIYKKLGVETRTAALLRAIDQLALPVPRAEDSEDA